MKIIENYNLADCSYFRVGGKARYGLELKEENDWEQLSDLIKDVNPKQIVVVGAGSNVLFLDEELDALIVKNNYTGWKNDGGKWLVKSGTMLPQLAWEVAKDGYTGIERLANVPGTVGGGVRGNAEAYNQAVSNCLKKVIWWDWKSGEVAMNKEQCGFSYRESIFKRELDGRGLIKEVEFEFVSDDPDRLLDEIRKDKEKRQTSQPWEPSCGCFFKNVYLDEENRKKLVNTFGEEILGNLKLGEYFSAGRLIDLVGMKGYCVEGACVSEKHGNFIINNKQATTRNIFDLYLTVKNAVKEKVGIELENEVAIIGNLEK